MLEAAEKLGYVANQAGRSLRKGATGIIGFMIQTGHDITGQGDTFSCGFLTACRLSWRATNSISSRSSAHRKKIRTII